MSKVLWLILGIIIGTVIIVLIVLLIKNAKKTDDFVPASDEAKKVQDRVNPDFEPNGAELKPEQKTELKYETVSYSQLIKEQAVTDELNGPMLSKWFRENDYEEIKTVFFLAKPTRENSKMFAITDYPKKVDVNHYMLQVIVDADKNIPVKHRIISFNTVADGISELFNSDGYTIIKH